MKIAVTGHLGTLGTPLVERLIADGHDVTGIDIRHSGFGLRADVAQYRQIAKMPDDLELVYHLAGEFGRHNGEDFTEQLWQSNVIGTRNMLRLQKERGFRMIFASSSEVYGERGAQTLHEEMPPIYLPNDYAISKQVNEAQIANSDGETMILRICNTYGPGERYHAYRSVVCQFLQAAIDGQPVVVYPHYYRAFQYIDDFTATLAGCVTRFHAGETINLAGGDFRSVGELWEIVAGVTGVRPDRDGVRFEDTDGNNVVIKRLSNDKAYRLLGHDPGTPLETGVELTARWMMQRNI